MAVNLGVRIDVSAQNAIRMLGLTEDALDKLTKGFGSNQKESAAFQQAMANLATGLGIVQSGIQKVTENLTRMRDASVDAFRQSELALSKLDIAMGRVGDKLNAQGVDPGARKLAQEFDLATGEITRLAQTTEFTFPQITALMQSFIQSGLPMSQVTDTMGETERSLLSASVAMASASAGSISLEDAGQMLLRSVNSLGGSMGEIPKTADFMIRAINNSAISFHDMEIIIRSLSGVQASYLRQTRPQVILALAGALRAQGRSAAEAALDIRGFGRAMVTLVGDLRQSQMRKVRGLITTGGGRFSKKLFALSVLGISREDLIDGQGEIRDLQELIGNIRTKVGQLRAGRGQITFESRGRISRQNLNALRELGFDFEEGSDRILRSTNRLRGAAVDSIVKAAFGTMVPVNVLNSILNLERRYDQLGGEMRTFNQLSAEIGKSNNELADSQQRRLDTLEGQEHLRESALFELERQVGQVTGNFERLNVEVQRNLFGMLGDLLRENSAVRGFAGSFLILTENLGKALFAITGIGLAAVASMNILSASTFFSGSAGFAGVFAKSLSALAGILLPIIGSIAAFSFVVFVVSQRLERLQKTESSFFSSSALQVIKEFGGALKNILLPLLLGQKAVDEVVLSFNDLSMETKATVLLFLKAGTLIKAIFKGIVKGITFSIGIVVDALDFLAGLFANIISFFTGLSPTADQLSDSLKDATDSTKGLTSVLKPVAQILGVVLGPLLLLSVFFKIAGLTILAVHAPLRIVGALFHKNTMVMASYNLVMKAAAAIQGVLTAATNKLLASQLALRFPLLANIAVFVGLFLLVKALIMVFKFLVEKYQQAIASGSTLIAVGYGIAAVFVALITLVTTYIALKKALLIVETILGVVLMSSLPVWLATVVGILLVVGAVYLLIAALDWLFGEGDMFKSLTDGVSGLTDAASNLQDTSVTATQNVVQTGQSASAQGQQSEFQQAIRAIGADSATTTPSITPSSASGEAGSSSMPSLQNMSIPQATPTPVNITISSTVPPNRAQLAEAGRVLAPHITNAMNRTQSL